MSQSSRNQFMLGASSGLALAALTCYLATRSSSTLTPHEVEKQLGPYYSSLHPWFPFSDPKLPQAPIVSGTLSSKFCGENEIYLSRIPQGETGTSGWTKLLGAIQLSPLYKNAVENGVKYNVKDTWTQIPREELTLHDNRLTLKIIRATLMTLFALTNARVIFSHSSASGYRSSYPSYCGQWGISWPNGKPCVITFTPHDSHRSAIDVYPRNFPTRVEKCIEMLAGIISDGKGWKLAFPGRVKGGGIFAMRERVKGFPGAHGSRHLYNMMGGKVFEVDLLGLERVDWSAVPEDGEIELEVPVVGSSEKAIILVQPNEQLLLAKALDCLPWSHLSWSMHRGLKDILLAYGKEIMNGYRMQLASLFKRTVAQRGGELVRRGWDAEFVDGAMGDIASSSILSGEGNSGDLVRVVVGITEILLENEDGREINKDVTRFWRDGGESKISSETLDLETVVALVKFFVLEWSQELDYQLYHDIPLDLYLA